MRACAEVQGWVADWARDRPQTTVRVAEANVGVTFGVPTGIDWVFAQGHDSLIILEDDTLPAPDFFPFMQQMLARFADDDRVMMVSGNQSLSERLISRLEDSYWFSRFAQIWGWATWRRAWSQYDHSLSGLNSAALRSKFIDARQEVLYRQIWERQAVDDGYLAWDARWQYAVTRSDGFCVCPCRNLVRNIGFGDDSTHTAHANRYSLRPRQALQMPLRHPAEVEGWPAADRWWFDHLISKRFVPRLRRFFARYLPGALDEDQL